MSYLSYFRPSVWSEVSQNWPAYSKWDVEVVRKNLAARTLQNTQRCSISNNDIGCKTDMARTRVVPPSRRSDVAPKDAGVQSVFQSPLDVIMPMAEESSDQIGEPVAGTKKRVAKRREQVEEKTPRAEKRPNVQVTVCIYIFHNPHSASEFSG